MNSICLALRRWTACALGCAALLFISPVWGEEDDDEPAGDEPGAIIEVNGAAQAEEAQTLREKLTEREDETRVGDPLTLQVFGRPLALTGQYEILFDLASRATLGDPEEEYRQILHEQELELEAFYTINPTLSFFAQLRVGVEEEFDSRNRDGDPGFFVERGEFWLHAQKIWRSDFSIDVGRLSFEDDRRWWWDEDLDAFRVIWERDNLEIALAAAREVVSARSDREFVEPEHDDVFRLIGEISWDWAADHALQVFGLYHQDDSTPHRPGESVSSEREDGSDGDFFWFGIRAAGASDLKENGVLGYWVDLGGVVGEERVFESEEDDFFDSVEIGEIISRDVLGGGLDAGITYVFAAPADPRITLGYAIGSGDRDEADTDMDRSYRQTGLHSNEPGFGGVQSFKGYGRLLDPELSNISIITLGLGCKLFRNSSLDLVFHDYRLVREAESLRDSRIDATLTGEDHYLGNGIDLVLAVEEWKHFEFEVSASAFRAGEAFGPDDGKWVGGTFGAVRIAF